jgi:DNA-binding response OmpR family regulator
VRRDRGELGPKGSEIHVGRVRILAGSRRVLLDDNEIPLTTFEYELLLALAKRPGRVLSREQLLDLVHGSAEEAFDRSIDVHISRLRQKLGDDGRHAALVKTVRGIGYMLVAQDTV